MSNLDVASSMCDGGMFVAPAVRDFPGAENLLEQLRVLATASPLSVFGLNLDNCTFDAFKFSARTDIFVRHVSLFSNIFVFRANRCVECGVSAENLLALVHKIAF